MKVCSKCKQEKLLVDFSPNARARDGLRAACKSCQAISATAWYYENRERSINSSMAWKQANRDRVNTANYDWRRSESGSVSELLTRARRRVKQDSLPFTLTAADIKIPEVCLVFGKPLVQHTKQGPSPWSPSLDKIIPSLGYVPGNVQVLSHKANVMKNAASPEELLLFAAWINTTCRGNLA